MKVRKPSERVWGLESDEKERGKKDLEMLLDLTLTFGVVLVLRWPPGFDVYGSGACVGDGRS